MSGTPEEERTSTRRSSLVGGTPFGRRLSGIIDSKHAIIQGNMLGEHGMRLSKFAMDNDMVIVIRDLSSFAGSQLAERIQYDSPVSEGLMTTRSKSSSVSSDGGSTDESVMSSIRSRDSHRLEGAGKDLHLKAKSSIFPEIGGLIPAQNILSKKPAETSVKREEIDQYFKRIIDDPDSPYSLITPRKTIDGKEYDICFYCDPSAAKEVVFVYKDGTGKYYSNPEKSKTLITDEAIVENIQEVKVFADKKTKHPLIPDYDIAILGSKASSIKKILHLDYGIIRPEEEKIISELQIKTHNMIRHGADSDNPLGYKFEMTRETPYTIYTPDGNIRSIYNEPSYIKLINEEREKGYNLVLNPRTGVEIVGGKYVMPETTLRIDYKEIDSRISDIKDPTQREAAESIRDKEIQVKQISATLPSAYHAALVNQAREKGFREPTLDEAKRIMEEEKEALQAEYKLEIQNYNKVYKVHSPTEIAHLKKSYIASERMKAGFAHPHIPSHAPGNVIPSPKGVGFIR